MAGVTVDNTSDDLVERAAQMQQAATAAGWTYVGQGQAATGMAAAMGYEITNMCAGLIDGEPVTVFDVLQVMRDEQTAQSQLVDRETVAQMGFPTDFRLTVWEATGPGQDLFIRTGQRVELESGEFASRFHVYCDDQVSARMVLNPAVMAMLLDASTRVGLVIQKNLLQLSTPGTLMPPEQLSTFAAVAGKIRYSAISATSARL